MFGVGECCEFPSLIEPLLLHQDQKDGPSGLGGGGEIGGAQFDAGTVAGFAGLKEYAMCGRECRREAFFRADGVGKVKARFAADEVAFRLIPVKAPV